MNNKSVTASDKHLLLLLLISRNQVEIDSTLLNKTDTGAKRIIRVIDDRRVYSDVLDQVYELFKELYPEAEVTLVKR